MGNQAWRCGAVTAWTGGAAGDIVTSPGGRTRGGSSTMAPTEPDATGAPTIEFKDHFSGHAADYAAYRPTYPPALFEVLASLPRRRALALDCATGNGQAAIGLAERFDRVLAIDASREQLASARRHPRVEYRVSRADENSDASGNHDLAHAT